MRGLFQTPARSSRDWQSLADDDKRPVHKIEFQPVGGLKFFRQLDRNLEPAHWDDEFIRQFLRFNRANTDTWPERPYFARHFVRVVPEMYQSMTGTKLAWGFVLSTASMKRRI
jgi:hypothetical protein